MVRCKRFQQVFVMTYTLKLVVASFLAVFLGFGMSLSEKVKSFASSKPHQHPNSQFLDSATSKSNLAVMTITQNQVSALQNFQPQISNRLGMELVWIPSGKFLMGSSESEVDAVTKNAKQYDSKADRKWFIRETPQHSVIIQKGFYLGKYEVTQGQWKTVMKKNPSYFKGDCLPVDSVSWGDAQKFLQRLNASNDGYTYRLPTEAEWEYACRAGTTTPFAFGETITSETVVHNANYPFETVDKDFPFESNLNSLSSKPVGKSRPNAWEVYDMHGNLLEWCQDRAHDNYLGAPSNESAWESGTDKRRILRGGAWDSFAYGCRSAMRYRFAPETHSFNVGFRVVAESVSKP